MFSLEEFKTFNVNRTLDVDDLIAMSAFGRALRKEFEEQQVDEPVWVADQLNAFRSKIQLLTQDKKAARARNIEQQLLALRTTNEKRADLEKELAALRGTPATV